MPEPRKGFGREKAKTLVSYLKKYLNFNNFDYEYDAYIGAVEVLQKYCASAEQYDLDIDFINLNDFSVDYTKAHNRVDQTGNYRYDNNIQNFDFRNYALSRQSIRFF